MEERILKNYNTKKIYDTSLISKYVINVCHKNNFSISNLKLQYLMYYIQAVFLALENRCCFNDEIEAWASGPVVSSIYGEYKIFGSNNIILVTKILDKNPNSKTFYNYIIFDDSSITNTDKELIDEIIKLYGKYSTSELRIIACNEDPWKHFYNRNKRVCIPTNVIKKYYTNHYIRGKN